MNTLTRVPAVSSSAKASADGVAWASTWARAATNRCTAAAWPSSRDGAVLANRAAKPAAVLNVSAEAGSTKLAAAPEVSADVCIAKPAAIGLSNRATRPAAVPGTALGEVAVGCCDEPAGLGSGGGRAATMLRAAMALV